MARLASTLDELTRLQRDFAPALSAELFNGGTRIAGRRIDHAYQAKVPALDEHVLVALRGYGDSYISMGGEPTRHYPVRPGLVAVIPAGHDGTYDASGSEVSNIVLGRDRLAESAEQFGSMRPIELVYALSAPDPKLYAIMDLLSAEAELGSASSRLFVEQLLDLICTQLLRAHSAFSLPGAVQTRGLAPWQIKRVTSYMRDHLADDIGLQELADLVNLSRFHFCRAFRIGTGFTPHEWLTRLRVDEARKLLREPALSVTSVALAVGYQSHSAFSAAFRRSVGVSPTEFRRRL
jgi:AraC family transcriptional regulator